MALLVQDGGPTCMLNGVAQPRTYFSKEILLMASLSDGHVRQMLDGRYIASFSTQNPNGSFTQLPFGLVRREGHLRCYVFA